MNNAQSRLLFGGTFDPPHRAHVELPQIAARELGCDRIVYIPAAINPLKAPHAPAPPQPPPTPGHHRLAMLRLALQDAPSAEINDIELNRQGPSYTIDTLRALRTDASNAFLLIGADQALDFHRWKDWREILERATPAVMLRPPWTADSFAAALRERYDQNEARQWQGWTLQTLPTIDISATDVRARARQHRPLTGLVPPTVEAYIRTHGLYANDRGKDAE